MINRQQLLKDLQRFLPKIEQDILVYAEANSELNTHLKQEYAKAKEADRTAEQFAAWRESQITQAAAAWLLTCVFVRFLEDNELLDESMISGPAGPKLQHAKGRLTVYFNEHPTHAEREYLLSLFEELEQFPVMAELLDHRHNPLWQLPVSADGAKEIMDFFQKLDPETGSIVHDFTDPNWDTRFLGDLYQDLSESVRKRYALLQTPEFVENFILDYTLEKAKETFGLPGLRLLDPTCGSGHFLLTTFERLFSDWIKREPTTNTRALAQRALDSVFGVDINPYAIAIARFRLLTSAMKVSGSTKIRVAPDFHFNLGVGDSLLHGRRYESQGQGIQSDALDDPIAHVLEAEDRDKLEIILGQRYHVVAGNPPYITVKDRALNQAYRDKYPTCHRKYSLGVPFTERFFDLTLPTDGNHPSGYMGMITANSFMKREFGKKLIEDYLPNKDLTHVIDTSDAYIPGHGTSTVILFARNQSPRTDAVRAVLSVHGEHGIPDDPANGKVWRSIVELVEQVGASNDFINVLDHERSRFYSHPWSLGGGGAWELKEALDEAGKCTLEKTIQVIGVFGITAADDVMLGQERDFRRAGIESDVIRPIYLGDSVRDWRSSNKDDVLFPYPTNQELVKIEDFPGLHRWMWRARTLLGNRATFNRGTYFSEGRPWWEWHQISINRIATPLTITFGEVTTHNHFVLDHGGSVFNRTAPIIKLPSDASIDEHLSLLGILNSSTACFWMKQVFYPKGGDQVGSEGARVRKTRWDERYAFAGTGLKKIPIANDASGVTQMLAQHLEHHAKQLGPLDLSNVLENAESLVKTALVKVEAEEASVVREMISNQEELDWHIYHLYGLTDEDLCYRGSPPEVNLGERSFEICLARRIAAGEGEDTWFQRHNGSPTTEIPDHWPSDYRELIERRLRAAEENPWIKLIEQPEYKRRWNQESWEKRRQRALRNWLLNHLEQLCQAPELQTCAKLADLTRNDNVFQQVASLYAGTDSFEVQSLISELVAGDNVPQMAAARYKPKSIPKYRVWQETWDKQRAEDAIDARKELDETDPKRLNEKQAASVKALEIGDIPLPPRYSTGDFLKSSYWPLRGKLDMPKERFFSLPYCEKAGDSTLVIGWAGLDHLQRAQAIAAWYLDRKEQEGWAAQQLKPMLVALDELIPWLKQWHNEIDQEYGERMGNYYEDFLLEELRQLDISRDDLTIWEPPTPTQRGGRRRTVS